MSFIEGLGLIHVAEKNKRHRETLSAVRLL